MCPSCRPSGGFHHVSPPVDPTTSAAPIGAAYLEYGWVPRKRELWFPLAQLAPSASTLRSQNHGSVSSSPSYLRGQRDAR